MTNGSTEANNMRDPARDSAIAGEYVLGVLPEAERRTAEARIASEPAFAALVSGWQSDLSVLDEHYEEQNVPPVIKSRIDSRLFGDGREESTGIWASLAFWRGLAFASLLVVAGVGAVATGLVPFGDTQTGGGAPLVADLTGENAPISLVARFDPAGNTLRVIPAALDGDAEKSLELWVVPGDGVPVSLGVVPSDGGLIAIDKAISSEMKAGATLAISLEPAGGSPTGVATGPVLVVGALAESK